MKHTYRTFCILVVTLCFQIAGAQPSEPNTLPLSLEEAIEMALQQNLAIHVEQYTPQIKKQNITQAEAVFDHTLTADGMETLNESESDQTPQTVTAMGLGVEKRFSTGGSYRLEASTSMSNFDALDDEYSTGLTLTVSQALLKNRGKTVNTAEVTIARENYDIGLSELRTTLIDVVSQVKNVYWALVFARGDLEAKQLSLQLANDLVSINEAKVSVGTLAPLEVLQAQTSAASREVDIIRAQQTVRDTEDELRRLLNIPAGDPRWNARIVPTDEPEVEFAPISLTDSLQQAVAQREEIVQLRKNIAIQQLQVDVAENQLKPELNLQGSLEIDGLDTDLSGSASNLFEGDQYSAAIGLNLSYPLGNQAAKSTYNQARLKREQLTLSLHNQEQQIRVQVREAVRSVETSYKLVDTTRIALQLAEEQLDAELKKFEQGLSTNFQVLDYQDQLATAKSQHTQAITGYNQALLTLDQLTGSTLQRHGIVIKDES